MKITCQSCGKQYTIADEKVRGRTVKIRCKHCSSAIVVKGTELEQPEEEDDATRVYTGDGPIDSLPPSNDSGWMVTLDDGAQRSGTMDDLRAMFQAGHIHEDSFVWRDGMADWQLLSATPELLEPLRSSPSAAGPTKPPRPKAEVPATGAPDARLGGALFGGAKGQVAARVERKDRDQDLFGAPKQKPVEEDVATSAPADPMAKPSIPKFTAERGENSVLFTIDTIMAVGNQPARKPPSNFPEDDKVDIRALASVAPPPIDSGAFDQEFNPGPSFGGPPGGSLAAPMLPTTIEPDPIPEPEPMLYPYDAPPKSNKGIIIGLGAAVALLLIVSIAFGGYLLFGKEEPIAAVTPTETDKDKLAASDGDEDNKDSKDEDSKDSKDEDSKGEDSKDEDSKDEDSKDGKDGKKSDSDQKTATTRVPGPLPTTATATKTATKTATDTKKEDTKKEETKSDVPAATADRKFSRSAAVSALNSAAGAASGCKKPNGPTGRGRVSVTFAPSGRVTTAVVNGPPFAGTSVGSCVAGAFRRATVPPFDGSPVTVHKSFTIN